MWGLFTQTRPPIVTKTSCPCTSCTKMQRRESMEKEYRRLNTLCLPSGPIDLWWHVVWDNNVLQKARHRSCCQEEAPVQRGARVAQTQNLICTAPVCHHGNLWIQEFESQWCTSRHSPGFQRWWCTKTVRGYWESWQLWLSDNNIYNYIFCWPKVFIAYYVYYCQAYIPFNYISMYTARKFGLDLLRRSQNVVEEPDAANSKIIYKCHLITGTCMLRVRFYMHVQCVLHDLVLSITTVETLPEFYLSMLRYLTRITYMFPTNSLIFWCRQTRIFTRTHSNFPYDSAMIFCKIPRGWNLSPQICAENGKPTGMYVRSYVQCLYVHSQHTS